MAPIITDHISDTATISGIAQDEPIGIIRATTGDDMLATDQKISPQPIRDSATSVTIPFCSAALAGVSRNAVLHNCKPASPVECPAKRLHRERTKDSSREGPLASDLARRLHGIYSFGPAAEQTSQNLHWTVPVIS